MGNYGYGEEAMPGATLFSYVMFPLRIAFFSFFFCLLYPLMTVVALLRALYLRLVRARRRRCSSTARTRRRSRRRTGR